MLRRAFLSRCLVFLALPALVFGAPAPALAQVYEEPDLSFVLRTPEGFTGNKSVEGSVTTWKLRNNKEAAALGSDELVAVTVSALARTPGRDPEEEFRDYVQSFATKILHGGSVEDFRAVKFAGRSGFAARARGKIDTGAGQRPAVASVLLMEVDQTHVLVSAIAHGQGDRAFADVGASNGIFAPAEILVNPAPSTSSADAPPPTSTPPAFGGANRAILALLGIVSAVGAALILRRALKSRGRTPVENFEAPPTPASRVEPPPVPAKATPDPPRFCTECGALLTSNRPCPSCGAAN